MKKLLISFSGGRTSAYMTWELLSAKEYDEYAVVFANTGQEHPATLDFVMQCDVLLGFNTVWVEADVQHVRGKSSQSRIVNYLTASRDGQPFEEMIKKYGIPNPNFPHCTRELKLNPIYHYLHKVRGWKKGEYDVAIGIRADEFDRMSATAARDRIIYPLVRKGVTKEEVLRFWSQMPFDLQIPEHLGNCTWCWKKSLRKHLVLVREKPYVFDFPRRMEKLYPDAGPGDIDRPRRFFRGNRTVADLFALVAEAQQQTELELDAASSCNETCEIL